MPEINAWLSERNALFGPVERITTARRGIEETVMTLDGDGARVEVPVAVAADRADDGGIIELRVYWSMWPLTGEHHHRAPLLEPDPDLREPDIVGDYQRALAAGNPEAAVATFEPDAYVREPAGSAYIHRGHDQLRALNQRFFSNGGGIRLEHCALTDDSRACALEYNILRRGRTELSPEAGIAVYLRGAIGRLASAVSTTTSSHPSATCRSGRGPVRRPGGTRAQPVRGGWEAAIGGSEAAMSQASVAAAASRCPQADRRDTRRSDPAGAADRRARPRSSLARPSRSFTKALPI